MGCSQGGICALVIYGTFGMFLGIYISVAFGAWMALIFFPFYMVGMVFSPKSSRGLSESTVFSTSTW